MFTKIHQSVLRKKNLKSKIILICTVFILCFSGGHFLIDDSLSDPIIHNDVEDINLLITEFIGTDPNVLFVMDGSLSMADNFAGTQTGNWDGDSVIRTCNLFQNVNTNFARVHCQGNASGTNPCGSIACTGQVGACEQQRDFEQFVSCIESTYSSVINIDDLYNTVVTNACCPFGCSNPDPLLRCTNNTRRARAAAAMEVYALQLANAADPANFPLNCAAANCGGSDKSCNTDTERSNAQACLGGSTLRIQPTVQTCTSGELCSRGIYGSTRMDGALSTIFDFLDADDSLDDLMCDDTSRLFDGVNTSISCQDYMYTPFRNVRRISGDCSSDDPDQLPITGASDIDLIDVLTSDDAQALAMRFRSMIFSGTSATISSGGFAGETATALQNVWDFYDCRQAAGRTPLARAMGFDDNSSSFSGFRPDAISAFKNELQTDPAVLCRPQFVILLSDGEDTVSGDCDELSGSCSSTPAITGNANRRSSLQAVSNLRTHYVRNPVTNDGQQIKSEIITFVIGMGINDIQGKRTLNALALAGGTHTTGIIEHENPYGSTILGVDINSLLPAGSEFDPYRALARTDGLATNPTNATLQSCLTPNENLGVTAPNTGAHCHIGGEDIFFNAFFNSGDPFPLSEPFEDEEFAFFVSNTDELFNALQAIFEFIERFTTTGTAPAAPSSSTNVFLRDRIFLTLLRPQLEEPFWQGRLALYGFVDDPDNPGGKVVIRKPDGDEDMNDGAVVDSLNIFANDGSLDSTVAQSFFWEAGKKLAERDLSGSSNLDSNDFRDIFTIKFSPDPNDTEFDGSVIDTRSMSIRYVGERVRFAEQISPTVVTTLSPEHFSISDADVDPDGGGDIPSSCESSCDTTVVCSDITASGCKSCVKNCLRDQVVRFFSGDTNITPLSDVLGDPGVGATCTTDGNADNGEIGCDCPDLEQGIIGSNSQCSVRLGDMFHSAPVIVSSPNPFFFDTGFARFFNRFARRSNSLYVGSNSGAIHAFHAGEFVEGTTLPSLNPFTLQQESVPFFDEGTGREMFAFIPGYFMPDTRSPDPTDPTTPLSTYFNGNLPAPVPPYETPEYRFGDMKNSVLYEKTHRSYVDGSFLIADVWVDGYSNGVKGEISTGCDFTAAGADSDVDADGIIDGCGKEWHTVMIAGNRNGGGFYTTLDVTGAKCSGSCDTDSDAIDNAATIKVGSDIEINNPPQYPRHLWTLYDKHFGNTWSDPTIGRVRMNIKNADGTADIVVDRWLMFVGGGIDPENIFPNKDTDGDGTLDGADFDDNVDYVGNAFYAIDIATGSIVFKFHPSDSTLANSDLMVCEIASRVGVFDLNADGYTDIAYVGDTCGRLWRFDISTAIESASDKEIDDPDLLLKGLDPDLHAPSWTGSIAFCAGSNANCLENELDELSDPKVVTTDASAVPSLFPIYFPPSVVLDGSGRKHVIFVTGDRREPTQTSKFGKLYNFIDDFIPAFLAGGTAVPATKVKTEETLTDAGLVISLSAQSGNNNQFEALATDQTAINNQGEFMVLFPGGNNTRGEKGIGQPVVANRVLVFATFEPGALLENSCSVGAGVGRIFALDFLTGTPALARLPGSDAILSGTDAQKSAAAGKNVGEGIPTPAQLTFGDRGSLVMTIAFSGSGDSTGGSQYLVIEIADFPQRTQTVYWEELL
jgi:hypothetical protein